LDWVSLLKFAISCWFFGSVMAFGSPATGIPPLLPRRFCTSGRMVTSMKS